MIDFDTGAATVDPDRDAAQLVTTKEMMEGAAQKAVKEVMPQLETREKRVTEHLDCSLKNAVNGAVTGLTVELHWRMTTWESKMQNQWGGGGE